MRVGGQESAGVVEDDLPTGGFFLEEEGEEACRVAARFRCAGEVKASQD